MTDNDPWKAVADELDSIASRLGLLMQEFWKLWKSMHLAAGLISTMPQYKDRHPHDIAKWLYLGMPDD